MQFLRDQFAIMTTHTSALPSLVQQSERLANAVEAQTQSSSGRLIEDITSAADSEPDSETEVIPSTVDSGPDSQISQPVVTQRGVRQHQVSCTRPCRCQCHKNGRFSWARCDSPGCRRNDSSSPRKATWSVYLAQWLGGYGVSISVSVSLRPFVVISSSDMRYNIVYAVETVSEDMFQRVLEGTHPLDRFEEGITVLEVSKTFYEARPASPSPLDSTR